jgi:hypothetical protein
MADWIGGRGSSPRNDTIVAIVALQDNTSESQPSSRAHCLVATFLRPGHLVNGNIAVGVGGISSPGGKLCSKIRAGTAPAQLYAVQGGGLRSERTRIDPDPAPTLASEMGQNR